jgi:transcriptional regulator with XRE-family HTH domain
LCDVPRSPEPAPSPFARAASAAIRRLLGELRYSQAALSRGTSLGETYIAERLRDEKSFTLSDIEEISGFLGIDPEEFLLDVRRAQRADVGASDDDYDFTAKPPTRADVDLAAKEGTRKIDQD